MSYGIPYQGSKSRIAEWVVGNLPPAPVLVDLFAGGCAVTHCALMSGKYGRVLANDLTAAPGVFRDAAMGEFDGYCTVPTHEEFDARKEEDDALALLYSFGNNRAHYLWSADLEAVKVPASKMVLAPSVHERRVAYRDFIKALKAFLSGEGGYTLENLEGVERTERLQNVERLKNLQGTEAVERVLDVQGLEIGDRLEVRRGDYRGVEVPEGALVYADPPYRNTDCRAYSGFDFEAFDRWLDSVPFMVVVSEYTCPEGCVEVAAIEKQCSMSANGRNQKAVERLFVQERYAGEYNERMGRLAL